MFGDPQKYDRTGTNKCNQAIKYPESGNGPMKIHISHQDEIEDPNPEDKDTEGDGLPDEKEKTYETDPNNPDTDGDGLSENNLN